MIASLLNQFDISVADQNLMMAKMKPFKFNKNQVLEDADSDSRYIYFIKQGILRSYHFDHNLEVNTYFAPEGKIISAFGAIIGNQNHHFIGAIEDGLALRLSAKNYLDAFDKINGWERLGRYLAEENYLCVADRMMNLNHLTAKQKYIKFCTDFGEKITTRLPDYHIASYLGITPESLSRVKRK